MDEGESKQTMRMEEKKENQFIDADRFLDRALTQSRHRADCLEGDTGG